MPHTNPLTRAHQSLSHTLDATRIQWPASGVTRIGKPPALSQTHPALAGELATLADPVFQNTSFVLHAPAKSVDLLVDALASRIRLDISAAITDGSFSASTDSTALLQRVESSLHPHSAFMQTTLAPLRIGLETLHDPATNDPQQRYHNAIDATFQWMRTNAGALFPHDPLADAKLLGLNDLASQLKQPFRFPQLATLDAAERVAFLAQAPAMLKAISDQPDIELFCDTTQQQARAALQQFRYSRFDQALITPEANAQQQPIAPRHSAKIISLKDRLKGAGKDGQGPNSGSQSR